VGRIREILRRCGTTDPARSCNPGLQNQKYGSRRIVSKDPKMVAMSSPPKCGCDVNSATESMQVAKFTKYAGSFSVILVV